MYSRELFSSRYVAVAEFVGHHQIHLGPWRQHRSIAAHPLIRRARFPLPTLEDRRIQIDGGDLLIRATPPGFLNQILPLGEWVDLDIDRSRKEKPSDWMWNSEFRFLTKIDEKAKVWICEMQIPWKSIDPREIRAGNELRLNLYRIEGGPEERTYMALQPVHSDSFHTPERFGLLRLR